MKLLYAFVLVSLLKHAGAACYSNADPPLCSSCSGSCSTGNGCFCSDGLTLCIPTLCDISFEECCPIGLFWDSVNSCCSDTLVCSASCFSDEICTDVSNVATCLCNYTAYKNQKLADLKPTVNCEDGVITVSVSKCLLGSLGYDYTTFRLKNDTDMSCSAPYPDRINNQTVESFQVKAAEGICGNIITLDSSKVTFTNILFIDILQRPLITINPIEMSFSCSYNLTMQTSLDFTLHPVKSTTYLNTSNGESSYPFTMAAYKNSDYSNPFQEDDTVNVASDIYLGLYITGADGSIFVLRVVRCFASPTNDPDNVNKVELVSGGCPTGGDVSTTVDQNGVSLESRIRISAFAFQGYGDLYLFCYARLCNNLNETCTGCQNGRTAESAFGGVSMFLKMYDVINFDSSGTNTVVSSAALVGCLLILHFNNIF